MGPAKWLAVSLSQFEVGLPLRYDIFTNNGQRLAKAGEEFSESSHKLWLQSGVDSVLAKVTIEVEEGSLLAEYDQRVIQRLQRNLDVASSILVKLAEGPGVSVSASSLDQCTTETLASIEADSSAALLVVADSILRLTALVEDQKMLADRSAQLSLLSMAIAFEMGFVPRECQIVGTAALLHDVSLLSVSDMKLDNHHPTYRQHPLQSKVLVESIAGIHPKAIAAIPQVHEMLSGDGFPSKLRGDAILPIARVIGIADMYLTLTSSASPRVMPKAMNYHPADAIGYLMFHATHGRFEVEAIRALIRATSLYPIGSSVILSDDTPAIVFRSSRTTATKPIVRLNSDQTLVDLRTSGLSILGPNRQVRNHNVLQKADLEKPLW